MNSITYSFPYRKDTDLAISASELIETYFFGIPLKIVDGRELTLEAVNLYIRAAQDEVERYLNLKIVKQIISESKDFYAEDMKSFNFIRCTYPVTKAYELKGFINEIQQIDYPKEWISSRKTSDGVMYFRNIFLVPGNGSATSNSMVFSGVSPHMGWYGNSFIPNYWRVKYCTGFDKVPAEIINAIGRLAAINVFHILGDLILGAGIASFSIGIDGLSQSISTTSSATNAGYGSRILGYVNDLKRQLPGMRDYYAGIRFGSM